MHLICDDCFKEAEPLEELTIGALLTVIERCPYCGMESAIKTMHYLAGASVRPEVLKKLGFEVMLRVLVRKKTDAHLALVHVLRSDMPSEMMRIPEGGSLELSYNLKT